MIQHDFDYPSDHKIEGVEERLLDDLCGQFSTNVKDVIVKTVVDDVYKNFVVELENGKELDCEISYDVFSKKWEATVWEFH